MLSRCCVGVGIFVIGLSQISSFFSSNFQNNLLDLISIWFRLLPFVRDKTIQKFKKLKDRDKEKCR